MRFESGAARLVLSACSIDIGLPQFAQKFVAPATGVPHLVQNIYRFSLRYLLPPAPEITLQIPLPSQGAGFIKSRAPGLCEPGPDGFLRYQAGSFSARAPTTYEYV
jgi:hypothetical protein